MLWLFQVDCLTNGAAKIELQTSDSNYVGCVFLHSCTGDTEMFPVLFLYLKGNSCSLYKNKEMHISKEKIKSHKILTLP